MKKNRFNLIILILTILILFMGIGYSILATRLYINGTAKVVGKWNIEIESITALENDTSAVSKKAEITSATLADFGVELYKPGDYMEYKVVIKNSGNIDAKLDSVLPIIIDEYEDVEFSNNAVVNSELNSGETAEIIVKVEFNENATKLPEEEVSSNYILKLNYVQK